jgi:hypothetical protein
MKLVENEVKKVTARGPHDPEAPTRALAEEMGVA